MTAPGPAMLDDLAARGLIQDSTDRQALRQRLEAGPVTLYAGFDPTSDSLHVGHLLPLLTLRRFQLAGHRPIALAGGATGMIGDPSGRSDERVLLDDDRLTANLQGVVAQLRRFLDFDGPGAARLVDNRTWTSATSVVDFLRDVGKHVTVNQMLGKESVRTRMESAQGLSYTEFSYMLLQANDYLQLHDSHGCELQIGGSDQWGNITAGVDLIRRRRGARVHALTMPLLLRTDGTKFGKTAAGDNLWLDARRLSPYRFYQAWMQTPDDEVRGLLLRLTLLPVPEIRQLGDAHATNPGARLGQRRLAQELTTLVHGPEQAQAAQEASAILFGGAVERASAATLEMLAGEIPVVAASAHQLSQHTDVDLFADLGIVRSRGEARRLLTQGGWTVNGRRLQPGEGFDVGSLLHGRYALVRRGKSVFHLLILGTPEDH